MAKKVTESSVLDHLLTHTVCDVLPKELLRKKLERGETMKIYLGVDPTGPAIHLGHAVILHKLRAFQELGHDVVLLIGDFTARIGDPTDRSAARVTMTAEEVRENAKTYKKQAAKILDFSSSAAHPARIDYNSRWLGKMNFQEVLNLSAQFTVQQMLERDMFEKRMSAGKPIYLHEFLYPVMQGYDSVAQDVDMEVGGSDQTFNMLAGRTLLKSLKGKEKVVMTFELLPGVDGRKMSKSYGNVVGITDAPNEMFGKIMSLQDDLILTYFRLCGDARAAEVEALARALRAGENPRDLKMRLARQIVTLYHSASAANQAEKEFIEVFRAKGMPTDMVVYPVAAGAATLVDVLVDAGLASSKGEARRLIDQGGVRVNGKKISAVIPISGLSDGDTLQVGKRTFVTLRK